MRVLVATDSYGGTLTAREAGYAIAEGWGNRRPQDAVTVLPMSDGGEGLVDALQMSRVESRQSRVTAADGHEVLANWIMDAHGTAIIEAAAACALPGNKPDDFDPICATTRGVGELLLAAQTQGAKRIIVGLGGSCTVDGGVGALNRLGFELLDDSGQRLEGRVGNLHQLAQVLVPETFPVTAGIEVWADVRTTLIESVGMFGPQKGLAPERVGYVEEALNQWATCVEERLHGSWRTVAGSGAAGGLGFAMAAIGGTVLDGGEAFAQRVALASHIAEADLVITGEGRLDRTSFEGKVVALVVGLASEQSVPIAAVVGIDALESTPKGLETVVEASPEGPGARPAHDVARAAEGLAANFSTA